MLITDRLAIKLGYNPYTDNFYEFWLLGMVVAILEYALLGLLIDLFLGRTKKTN
jgi:hypothetical protein